MSDLSDNIMGLATVGLTAGMGFATINMINNLANNSMPQSRKSRKQRAYQDDIFAMPYMNSGKKSKKKQSYDFELF